MTNPDPEPASGPPTVADSISGNETGRGGASADRPALAASRISKSFGGLQALTDVSIELHYGRVRALLGDNGAGKSTLVKCICGMYLPDAGTISIDGRQHRIASPDTARALGIETVHQTLAMIDTLDVVENLPDGFDTVVGERGYRLSGGEKQRLAIARMLLKDPRILILDEATSSLDSHSERAVQTALARLTKGRTTIVIAHRLSTVLAADLILYIDEGRVVERGTHAELMALDQRYAELCREQFASMIEADSLA